MGIFLDSSATMFVTFFGLAVFFMIVDSMRK
jgi:hypothetical protein